MKPERQYLDQMIRLIEQGWCKDVGARSASGAEVRPRDPQACQFCILGAWAAVEPAFPEEVGQKVYDRLQVAAHLKGGTIALVNDEILGTSLKVRGFLREVREGS